MFLEKLLIYNAFVILVLHRLDEAYVSEESQVHFSS